MTSASLRILVLEDDYFTAERLCREIRANGDTVVGPFTDVHDAMPYVELVQAAILDVKVHDETSFQVADSLTHHNLPFVFLTGYDQEVVPARFERRHVIASPAMLRSFWTICTRGIISLPLPPRATALRQSSSR